MEYWGSAPRNEWENIYGSRAPQKSPPKNTDPTFISLTKVEFNRLVNIETTAQAALHAMSIAPVHEKDFSDAAEALNIALHSPAFGG